MVVDGLRYLVLGLFSSTQQRKQQMPTNTTIQPETGFSATTTSETLLSAVSDA